MRIASEGGRTVSVDPELVRGLRSTAVRGMYTTEQALEAAVAGAPVEWVTTPGGALTLRGAPPVTTILAPVRVHASAERESAPMPYAGGQVARGGRLGLLGDRDFMETPFSMTSYAARIIEDQQARSVADVLDNDVAVRNIFPRTGFADQFMMRGFPVLNSDIAFDGLVGIVPHNNVNLAAVERIEVLKGPNALLGGMSFSGAVGGAINLVPKQADTDPVTQLTGTYGSRGQLGGQADVGRRFGPDASLGVRAQAGYRAGDTAVADQRNEHGFGAVALDYSGSRFKAVAHLGHQADDLKAPTDAIYVLPGFPLPGPPDAGRNFMQPWTFSHSRDTYGSLRLSYELTDETSLTAAYGRRHHRYESLVAYNQLTSPTGSTTGMAYYYPYFQDTDAFNLGLRTQFRTAGVRHALSASFDGNWRKSGSTTTLFGTVNSNIYESVLAGEPDWSGISDSAAATAAVRLTSLALADTVYLARDRLQLTLGIRSQSVQTDAISAATGARQRTYDKRALTPALGVLFKASEQVSVYGNYIEGLSQGQTAPAGTANAGQQFSPYKSRQYEAGVKWDGKAVAATLAAFQIVRPSAYTDPATMRYEVNGRQRNRGIEFNVFGSPLPRVRVLSGLAYTDAVQTRTAGGAADGNAAIGVPAWQMNLGGEWDPAGIEGLTLTGRVLYTGKQYLDAANSQEIPDWVRLDLGARYKVPGTSGAATVRLDILNVLDKNYWASTANGRLVISAPRMVKLSVSMAF